MLRRNSLLVLKFTLEELIEEAKVDRRIACDAYIENAAKGDGKALFQIGKLYYALRWYHAAMAWFIQAAKKENMDAQRKMGVMYQEGFGVDVDITRALVWFHRSARQGCRKAHKNIRFLYINGHHLDEGVLNLIKSMQEEIDCYENKTDVMMQEHDAKRKLIVQQYEEKIKDIVQENDAKIKQIVKTNENKMKRFAESVNLVKQLYDTTIKLQELTMSVLQDE